MMILREGRDQGLYINAAPGRSVFPLPPESTLPRLHCGGRGAMPCAGLRARGGRPPVSAAREGEKRETTMTQVVRAAAALADKVEGWKRSGMRVGVVPTMGALHDGHLSLLRTARRHCDRVIVTIFVNPLQFDRADDLEKYPRDEARDLALLEAERADVLFAPGVGDVYPDGFSTRVSVAGISEELEGAFRPGHFDGMTTVVTKILGMAQAGWAFFGEKDWQQLQIVRRLVTDLNLPVRVTGCPTVREPDGLALSSRNARLTPEARRIAPALYQVMQQTAQGLRAGRDPVRELEDARSRLIEEGFASLDYLELRHAETLRPLADPADPARLLAAAWLGGVRLIDNIAI